MSLTSQDLASFNTFVASRLTTGTAASLVELAREWERDRQETVAELRSSLADMEAGHGRPLTDFATEMRRKHQIPTGD